MYTDVAGVQSTLWSQKNDQGAGWKFANITIGDKYFSTHHQFPIKISSQRCNALRANCF